MISIQLRVYSSADFSYVNTIALVDASPAMVEFTIRLIQGESKQQVHLPDRKNFNFCNMMIRENGKLVSYKKFIK